MSLAEPIDAIRAHRLRLWLDNEIARFSLQHDDISQGIKHGLMKARVEVMTSAELAESARVRAEMFG